MRNEMRPLAHGRLLVGVVVGAVWLMPFVGGAQEAAVPGPEPLPAHAGFEQVEQMFRASTVSLRYRYPSLILRMAVYAETCEDEEIASQWCDCLLGTDTRGRKAYGILREVMGGEFGRLLELPETVSMNRWHELVAWTVKKAPEDLSPQARENAAAGLCVLVLSGSYGTSTYGVVALKTLTNISVECRARLVATLMAARDAGAHAVGLSRLRSSLRYALRSKRLVDPAWCTILYDLTTDSGERLELLRGLRYARDRDFAADLALRAVASHPGDGPAMLECFELLLRGGKGEEAFSAMVMAEEAVPYPGRREVRMRYFTRLRSERARSDGKRRLPEGMLTYDQEREERVYAATYADDLEARMALADLYAVERKITDAASIYREIHRQANDAALRWAAWLAWAEGDAVAAWRDRLRPGTAPQEAGSKPPIDESARLAGLVSVAIAAGAYHEARDLLPEGAGQADADRAQKEMACMVAAICWATGDTEPVHRLMAGADVATKLRTLSCILGLSGGLHAATTVVPAGLARALTRNVATRFAVQDSWAMGLRFVLSVIPTYGSDDAVTLTRMWSSIVLALPKDDGGEHERLLRELTESYLAWTDKQPQDQGRDLTAMLQYTARGMRSCKDRRAREAGLALLSGCLERAAMRGVKPEEVRQVVREATAGLEASEMPDAMLARWRETVARLYPDLDAPATE